jgi:hypothetical protein
MMLMNKSISDFNDRVKKYQELMSSREMDDTQDSENYSPDSLKMQLSIMHPFLPKNHSQTQNYCISCGEAHSGFCREMNRQRMNSPFQGRQRHLRGDERRRLRFQQADARIENLSREV